MASGNQEYAEALHRFEEAVHAARTPPEELALAIDAIGCAPVQRDLQLESLDRMAELVGERVAKVRPGHDVAITFMEVFRGELGFDGNTRQYDEADNSYLSRVLERRTGLPILLCLVCAAIGRRLGLQIDGLGFPGHFVARLRQNGEEWLLDPFHGSVLAPGAAEEYLSSLFGQPVTLEAEVFEPFQPSRWAYRILNNLRNVYRGSSRYEESARVLEFMLAIVPAQPALWRERALLHHHALSWEPALYDLRRYFFLRGQYSFVWGTDDARAHLLQSVSMQDRQLFALYQKLQELAGKAN